jgi:Domain of unknown function (DUF5982)/Omp85 superfamily domain
MHYYFFLIFICTTTLTAYAQVKDTAAQKLPFSIANEKRLPDDELADKREGAYVTGVPDISFDPLNGLGYGAEGNLFFNGKRTDPFFAYTPYRAEVHLRAFNTTRNERELLIGCDIPYIFNTKWRFRGEVVYEVNPNNIYFGVDDKSLQGLSYYQNNDSSIAPVHNASFSNYTKALDANNNSTYNSFLKQEALLNVSMECSFFDGKLRALIGYEFAHVNFSSFSANSLLQQQFNANKIVGVGSYNVTFLQGGFIYDTRNLETDPSNGTFAQLLNEVSLKALGSQYNFNKTFAHINYYKKLLPSTFKKLVFAGRIAMGYTAGNAPFFEYQDQWSSEGSIEGLGGGATLRGYKQSRFLGRVMQFNNVELRYKFYELKLLKQNLAFSGVPFVDAGAVWNNFNGIAVKVSNYRYCEGIGLRIAWNVNTILRFDYAVSHEDKQFFFQFGHTF